MDLIGRRVELDQIARMGTSPHESALLVVGDVGVGKTRLLEAARDEAAVESVLLRVNPADATWPLSGFFTFLASMNSSRALDLGAGVTLTPMEPAQMFAAAREILSLVRGLSLPPILLLVDDIDTMDEVSQTLVGFMAGRLGGTGIRLIATSTGVEAGSQFGGLPTLRLDPLSAPLALELAHAARPDCHESGSLGIIVDHAQRNPRAILESMTGLTIDQLDGLHPLALPLVPGATARAYARTILPSLSPAQLQLLERLSAAPMTDLISAIRGGVSDEDALQDLVFLGVVDVRGGDVRIKKPLLRSHVYWSMTSRARRELHLAEAQDSSSRCAPWHQSFGPIEPTNADRLLEAAIALAKEGSTSVAIEFADRALILAVDSHSPVKGVPELARILFERGELALATRYVTCGLQLTSSASISLELTLLRLVIDFMRDQRVPDLDIQAWEAMYSRDFPQETAEMLAVAAMCRALRWELKPARKLLERARNMAPAIDGTRSTNALVTGLVRATDGQLSRTTGPDGPTVPWSQDGLASRPIIHLLVDARASTLREEYSEARRLCSIILNRRPHPEPVWTDTARYLLADNDLRSGDLAAALITIGEWNGRCIPGSRPAFHSYLDAWLAYAEDRLPDADAIAAAELGSHRRDRSPALSASLLALRGEMALIEGDVDKSGRMLMMADIIDSQIENPSLVRHTSDLIEAHCLAGRQHDAQLAHDKFTRRAREYPSRWGRVALTLTTAMIVENDAGAILLFDEALNSVRPGDSRLQVARIHAAKATRLLAMGLSIDAVEQLGAALVAFESVGARAWVRRMNKEIAQLTPEPKLARAWPVLAGLGPEEWAVAELVLKGYRNKEIAAELFISLRTVEARLTHIYRSVGANSRSHLVSLMS